MVRFRAFAFKLSVARRNLQKIAQKPPVLVKKSPKLHFFYLINVSISQKKSPN